MVSSSENLSMQVNLFISARNLPDKDTFSKSDPVCIISEKKNGAWVKIGKTEQIKNSLNPDWKTSFTLGYFFEKRQDLRFQIVDDDGNGDSDSLGSIEATMGQVMGARA